MIKELKFVSQLEFERYQEDGFIVKENLLSLKQVEAVKEAFRIMVATYGPDRNRADLIAGSSGAIMGGAWIKKKNDPLCIQLEAGQTPAIDDLEKLELQVRKFMWFEKEAPIFQEILRPDSPMQTIVADLISDSPLLYQSLALIKPPKIGSTKPWHQDNAYFSVKPLESICGVWIAIDEATVQNGCMHMLRGQHKVGPLVHEHKRDCEINVRKLDLGTLHPVPLKPGSALFFNGMIPHETPPNRSDYRRRALQFHFRGSRSEILPGLEYDAVFKDANGQPASCEAVRRGGF
ncbi:MAG: phytanoyl-CoA dioxygenase family protein [Verrucomicrobiota bacterium]|nr:phytanoyl-CoA dioxygenase family protein [Verrucomicrobiota bacterium]